METPVTTLLATLREESKRLTLQRRFVATWLAIAGKWESELKQPIARLDSDKISLEIAKPRFSEDCRFAVARFGFSAPLIAAKMLALVGMIRL